MDCVCLLTILTLALTTLLWTWEVFDKYMLKEGNMEGKEAEERAK